MKSKYPAIFLSLILTLFVVAIDGFTKAWFFSSREIKALWPGVIEFIRHRNYGAVGNLSVSNEILLTLAATISLVIFFLILRTGRQKLGEKASLALILGGGIGNLFDRITLEYVRDWLLIGKFSIINIADIAIGLGVVLYIIFYSIRSRPEPRVDDFAK